LTIKEAARQIAELMGASLAKFSPEEQDRRRDRIHEIASKLPQSGAETLQSVRELG